MILKQATAFPSKQFMGKVDLFTLKMQTYGNTICYKCFMIETLNTFLMLTRLIYYLNALQIKQLLLKDKAAVVANSKECTVFFVRTNRDGSEKLPSVMTGKSANPSYFKYIKPNQLNMHQIIQFG